MTTKSRPNEVSLHNARTRFLRGIDKNLADIDELKSEFPLLVRDWGGEVRIAIGWMLADLSLGDIDLGLTDDLDTQLCDVGA